MSDNIKHPSHYAEGRKYEPKDVIRDWGLNFNLGSAVKYISRAGRKDDIVQDLKKAQQFIQFEIDAIEAERGNTPKVECKDTHKRVFRFVTLDSILAMGVSAFERDCRINGKPIELEINAKRHTIIGLEFFHDCDKCTAVYMGCRDVEGGIFTIQIGA